MGTTPRDTGSEAHAGTAGRLRRVVLVEPGEVRGLLWSAGYIFLLFTSYSILRPVRETMGIERGADNLPSLITATLITMALATPVFGWIVSRLPRRRFIPLVYRFFAANLLVFFGLFYAVPEEARVRLGYAFYVWLSVFNLFVVSVFWGFMADVWTAEQGKRLFGFIGVGATLGAIVGSAFTAFLVEHIGRSALMLVSAALIEAAAWCMVRVAVRFGVTASAPREQEPGPGALQGLKLVLGSPYLLAISMYMLTYTVCSTFLYLKVGEVVDGAIQSRDERTAFYASITLWTNILTLLTQVFLTSRIVRWAGVGVALTAVPIVTIAGFIVLGRAPEWGIPLLTAVFAFNVARGWTNYAVSRPSREMLFSVLSRDAKYKAKPFVDTFVYRGGDALGAWGPTWLAKAGVALWGGAVAIGAAGLVLGLVLGRWRRARGESQTTTGGRASFNGTAL